jgi:poly-beta-1,6-N-acetyl-D-glucosamine biosynthesis protein PgaD
LSSIAYTIPPRKQRKQRQRSLHFNASGLIWPCLVAAAGYYILTSDFSHLDRNTLPFIFFAVCGAYLIFFLWAIIKFLRYLPSPSFSLSKIAVPAFASSPRILINSPKLKSYLTRMVESAISIYAWGFFLYFFQPMLTALFWLITGKWVYWHAFSYGATSGTLDMMYNSVVFAAIIFIVFWSWAKWNLYHYGGLDRRKPRPPTKDSEVAQHFGVSLDTVHVAQRAKIASLNPLPHGAVFTIHKYTEPVEKEAI